MPTSSIDQHIRCHQLTNMLYMCRDVYIYICIRYRYCISHMLQSVYLHGFIHMYVYIHI